jgi:hypothetical protein
MRGIDYSGNAVTRLVCNAGGRVTGGMARLNGRWSTRGDTIEHLMSVNMAAVILAKTVTFRMRFYVSMNNPKHREPEVSGFFTIAAVAAILQK